MASQDQPWGCLLRLFWMVVGNLALFLVAMQLFHSDRGMSWVDIAFWFVVTLIVAARYLDIRYFAGADGFGAPATLKEWKRHALGLTSLAGVAWLSIRFWLANRG